MSKKCKRIKLFEYLKSGFIFLQEKHSCRKINEVIRWSDKFNGELFFSHGKTNSCRVANNHIIAFIYYRIKG